MVVNDTVWILLSPQAYLTITTERACVARCEKKSEDTSSYLHNHRHDGVLFPLWAQGQRNQDVGAKEAYHLRLEPKERMVLRQQAADAVNNLCKEMRRQAKFAKTKKTLEQMLRDLVIRETLQTRSTESYVSVSTYR